MMDNSKTNFKKLYFTIIGEIAVGIIILILTYIMNLNFALFVVFVAAIISVITITSLSYLLYIKTKEVSNVKDQEEKRKRILDLDWKSAQPPEREKFMAWMDDD